MNTLKRILLALAVGAGFSATVLLADPAAPSDGHAGKTDKKPRISRVEKLNTELALTDEQKTQIAGIYKDEGVALKAISDDKTLERSAKIAKNKEIREAHAAKVRALLTPEQQGKFDALTAKVAAKEKTHDDEKH